MAAVADVLLKPIFPRNAVVILDWILPSSLAEKWVIGNVYVIPGIPHRRYPNHISIFLSGRVTILVAKLLATFKSLSFASV